MKIIADHFGDDLEKDLHIDKVEEEFNEAHKLKPENTDVLLALGVI